MAGRGRSDAEWYSRLRCGPLGSLRRRERRRSKRVEGGNAVMSQYMSVARHPSPGICDALDLPTTRALDDKPLRVSSSFVIGGSSRTAGRYASAARAFILPTAFEHARGGAQGAGGARGRVGFAVGSQGAASSESAAAGWLLVVSGGRDLVLRSCQLACASVGRIGCEIRQCPL